MMARPDKADAAFLPSNDRGAADVSGVAPALWQSIAPDLWGFYMDNLPSQPTENHPDAVLVTQASGAAGANRAAQRRKHTLREHAVGAP